eukprot:CAMPEP_0204585848 /NCGR_PEP_ID=MMETSP0661-20131031/47153_1 /ASSEMBLY_ACC=CAM_ASM_000606 /TAXON_ID=109239 /ORGANISM="Alexandrium margalefi, Strain AMGDE01CS-322" /LENGTH=310 /DNA_ID=CAMNT_0051595435 /DNA_START=79 /DNA_END=1011 /DNA_ORIENTATION=-
MSSLRCRLACVLCWLCGSLGSVPEALIAPGVSMPMLALGTARVSLTGCSVQEAVEQWLALGGRHIDTAFDYGTQPDVGRALKATAVERREIFVTTKVPGPIGKREVMDLITKTSLPQLGLDYVDLVLIHFPCKPKSEFPDKCGRQEWHTERLATWEGLAELRSAGKIRAVGVSNYNTEHVAELAEAGARPAVNQVEWHLGYHNETLLAAMKTAGVHLEAWGSLSGPTTGRNPGVSLGDARLRAVAARYNASTAQVALRWSVQKGVAPVTASCSRSHVLGDLAAFDFTLSEDDVARLDSLAPAEVGSELVV